MDKHKIELVRYIDDAFLSDVLITAIETPFGDWLWAQHVERDADLNITKVDVAMDDPNEEEGSGKHTAWKTITPTDLVKGIRLAITTLGTRGVGESIINAVANNDAGEIDAIGADAILQYLLLGELVYG